MMVQFEADEVNANVTYGMFQGERGDWDSERVFSHERRACSDWQNELLVAVLSWLKSTHFRPCTFLASRVGIANTAFLAVMNIMWHCSILCKYKDVYFSILC